MNEKLSASDEIISPPSDQESLEKKEEIAFQDVVTKLKSKLADVKKELMQTRGPRHRERRKKLREDTRAIRDDLITANPQWAELIVAMTEPVTTEWSIVVSHALNVYKDRLGLLKIFWGFIKWIGSLSYENKLGVMAHAGAFQLLDVLGLNPKLPTPQEDAYEETDILVGGIPIQVKSATSRGDQGTLVDINKFKSIYTKKEEFYIYVNVNNLDPYTAAPKPEMIKKASEQIQRRGLFKSQKMAV